MPKLKKKSRWILGGLGVLLTLLLVVLLVLPKLINLEPVKQKLLAQASKAVGGQVECQRVELSFLPIPRVVVQQGRISIPGKVSGSLGSLTVYPEILPLFLARLELAEVEIDSPVFTLKFQEDGRTPEGEAKKTLKPLSFEDIAKQVESVFALAAPTVPDLKLQIKQARLSLSKENRPLLGFRNMEIELDEPNRRLRVEIDDFSFAAGQLLASEQIPQKLPQRKTGRKRIKELEIKGKSLEAALKLDEDRLTISLVRLGLEHPQLNLAGKALVNRASPRFSVELAGRKVDVVSTREVVLAMAGDDPDVKDIFDILKGGEVPAIAFTADGNSLDDLDELENMLIRGNMVDGKILVPEVDLELEDVKGEVVISKGILEGKNLEARLGNTVGRMGTLRLGLEGDEPPFHVDIAVDTGLVQLPPILKQLIEDKDFKNEIELVKNLVGRAKGRLVLGETTASIKAQVDVSELNLSANYGKIPFPIKISGGQFRYDEAGIEVQELTGKLGKSSFSGLSAGLDWRKAPHLEVKSGSVSLLLDEFYPWLSSFEGLRGLREEVRSLTGTVEFSSISIEGPLLEPEKWHYESTGELQDVALNSTLLPGQLNLARAKYKAVEDGTDQQIALSDAQIAMLDGSFQVSGVLEDYRRGLNKADLVFEGNYGTQIDEWISRRLHLPSEPKTRTPLEISKAHLVWEKEGNTSFSADLAVDKGPKVSLDILQTPQEFKIKNLLVQDAQSRASMRLKIKKNEVSLEFVGHLTESTLDNLFDQKKISLGWIKGNLRARILKDQPMESTAQGSLSGEDLVFPYELVVPLRIERISLNAKRNSIKVDSAVFNLGDLIMALEGDVGFAKTGFRLDMDLSSDALDWSSIEKTLQKNGEQRESKQGEQAEDTWDLPLQGIVRTKVKKFKFEGFTWSPLHADITLGRNLVYVAVNEADLCGISTPGFLQVSPREVRLEFTPSSKNEDLDPAIRCLLTEAQGITGSYDLTATVSAQGKGEDLVKSAQGNVDFLAEDGRIYRTRSLPKVFDLLQATDVFKGKLPDIRKEGLAYKSMTYKGNLQNGKFMLTEGHLDSPSLQIFAHGHYDFLTNKIEVTVLVAPFRTVDRIVKHTPVFGKVLGGTLVSVPIRIEGDINDPRVDAIPASAVGLGLLGVAKRAVKYPVQVVQPLVGDAEKEAEKQ